MELDEFDQRAAELTPDKMMMKSELELSMYTITNWRLVYLSEGKHSELN